MSVKSEPGLPYKTWDNRDCEEARDSNRKNFPRVFIGSYAIEKQKPAGKK